MKYIKTTTILTSTNVTAYSQYIRGGKRWQRFLVQAHVLLTRAWCWWLLAVGCQMANSKTILVRSAPT
jgi:hypothetical protein